MYSDMIENAAAVLSEKSGWNHKQSVEYIEDMVFNSDEDIQGLLTSILNGTFTFHPPVRIRRGIAKRKSVTCGRRRDGYRRQRSSGSQSKIWMSFMMRGGIISAAGIRLRSG